MINFFRKNIIVIYKYIYHWLINRNNVNIVKIIFYWKKGMTPSPRDLPDVIL